MEFDIGGGCVSASEHRFLAKRAFENGELRGVCGFDPHRGSGAVPPSWIYTRFLKLLLRFNAEIDGMFDHLVDDLKRLLPDLGFSVAVDSKGVNSAGKPTKKAAEGWTEGHGCGLGEEGFPWEKRRRDIVGEGCDMVWVQDSSVSGYEI